MLKKLLLIIGLFLFIMPTMAQSMDACSMIMDMDTMDEQDTIYASSQALYADEAYQEGVDLLSDTLEEMDNSPDLYLHRACHYAGLEEFESAYMDMLAYITPADAMQLSDEPMSVTVTLELPESTTVDVPELGGSIFVSYPEGWVTQDQSGAILLGTSEEALAIQDPTQIDEIPTGTVIVNVTIIPAEMAGFMGLAEDATPADVLDTFLSFVSGEGMPEFSDIEEMTIDDTLAARAVGQDDTVALNLYVLDNGDAFVVGFGATRADEAEEQAETIQAIVASAQFTVSEPEDE